MQMTEDIAKTEKERENFIREMLWEKFQARIEMDWSEHKGKHKKLN